LRKIGVALAVVTALMISVAPASAIVYGEFDNGQHPNVGAYIIKLEGTFRRICSGTLIDSNTFLTAAHCVFGADRRGVPRDETFVTFDEIVSQKSKFLSGTAIPDPRFGTGGANDANDIAVIELDHPVRGIAPAQLPTAGLLDEMKSSLSGQTFTAVGYGTIRETKTTGPHAILPNLRRRKALQSFQSLTAAWLTLKMNEATGQGGTCFGDSGGPHFLGGYESNLIVSLTVTGDAVCVATDKTYRVDTAPAREFLDEFVALP
jgi:secreted trypsin-like serine protease